MRTFYKLTPDEIKQVQTEIKAKKAAAKEDELKRLESEIERIKKENELEKLKRENEIERLNKEKERLKREAEKTAPADSQTNGEDIWYVDGHEVRMNTNSATVRKTRQAINDHKRLENLQRELFNLKFKKEKLIAQLKQEGENRIQQETSEKNFSENAEEELKRLDSEIPASAKINIPAEAYENYKDSGYNLGFSDIKGIGYILEGQIGIKLATDLSADKLVVMCGDKTIELTQKDGYVEFFVAAQDMAKEYTVYYVDGENKIEISKFNPKNNLSGYEDTEYKAVAEALITYCEAANAYFNDGTVANYSSEWESVKSAIGENTVDMGENYYGSSLLLESDTILRHYYTEEVAGYTGIKGDYYYIDETVDPTKFAATGTYSVNDYIYKALTGDKADTNLKNLCVALYKYGVAAEALKNGGNN